MLSAMANPLNAAQAALMQSQASEAATPIEITGQQFVNALKDLSRWGVKQATFCSELGITSCTVTQMKGPAALNPTFTIGTPGEKKADASNPPRLLSANNAQIAARIVWYRDRHLACRTRPTTAGNNEGAASGQGGPGAAGAPSTAQAAATQAAATQAAATQAAATQAAATTAAGASGSGAGEKRSLEQSRESGAAKRSATSAGGASSSGSSEQPHAPPPVSLSQAPPGKRPAAEGVVDQTSVDPLYQRAEHKYREGAVCARPGEVQRFEWGQVTVLPLPRAVDRRAGRAAWCAGCRYALEGAPSVTCKRCDRCFHAEDESLGLASCFGSDTTDASDMRYCIECLPPGPELEMRREQLVIVHDFEKWGFSVIKLERVNNPRLAAAFKGAQAQLTARRGGEARAEIHYHLSSAGWGHVCESGLRKEYARPGFFGKALYFSPDPKKCDDYWVKATRGSADAGAVVAASTGKDPTTTRVLFACRVLLGKTYKYAPNTTARGLDLDAPPEGYDSVSGFIHGQRELAVYANESALLEVCSSAILPRCYAVVC